jgi:hypothetical protein
MNFDQTTATAEGKEMAAKKTLSSTLTHLMIKGMVLQILQTVVHPCGTDE